MSKSIYNKKRIIYNTSILYIKLIISTIISFWLSRVVLETLGASDYGLYNVVGGIVSLLNIMGTAMNSTSYRYMAVELGKREDGNPNKIYNTIFTIHAILAIFLIIIGNIIGNYYICNKLNIPNERIDDALFIFHISIFTTAFAIITVPLNGLIIAKEKFLFTSIIDISCIFLKLVLIYAISHTDSNKLRLYAVILAIIQLITPITYQIYCRTKEKKIIKWNFNKNIRDYKDIAIYTFWILIGAIACIASIQGVSLIINIFWSTILNAAFGLATQVYTIINQFTTTLRQAAIPQIMKTQASGDEKNSLKIVYKISKFSFLCMLIPSTPIITCLDGLLKIWLITPPNYTSIFIVLLLINGLISNISAGFDATIQATGKIKKNQIGYSIINISILPFTYIMYKIGFPPYANCIVMICLSFVTLLFQCSIMHEISAFKYKEYFEKTIIPITITVSLAWFPLFCINNYFNDSFLSIALKALTSLAWTIFIVSCFGITRSEKDIVRTKIFKTNKQ